MNAQDSRVVAPFLAQLRMERHHSKLPGESPDSLVGLQNASRVRRDLEISSEKKRLIDIHAVHLHLLYTNYVR